MVGGYGEWMFIEISDPWDVKNTIRYRMSVTEEDSE
jgi:hypothetical protein